MSLCVVFGGVVLDVVAVCFVCCCCCLMLVSIVVISVVLSFGVVLVCRSCGLLLFVDVSGVVVVCCW